MRNRRSSGISLLELLIVVSLLLVMLAPFVHIYILTTRGMRGSMDEQEATQICVRLLEGFQSIPVREIPEEFPEAQVETLPAELLERLGWLEVRGFSVLLSIETCFVPVEDDSLDTLAPEPTDPRRRLLREYGELRHLHVRCVRNERLGPGRRALTMSTLVGRYR